MSLEENSSMANHTRMSMTASKQIKNLFLVLGSGVVFAGLVVWFLVSHYGEDGGYSISRALLSPKSLQAAKSMEISAVYLPKNSHKWQATQLSLDTYKNIYQLIARDKGFAREAFREVPWLDKEQTVRLLVRGRYEQEEVSQELEVFPNDVYRVRVTDQGRSLWVYFKHEHIKQQIMDVL
jgi:hypothetical protein